MENKTYIVVNDDILPCPFCGHYFGVHYDKNTKNYSLVHLNKKCYLYSIPDDVIGGYLVFNTRKELVDMINQRPQ